MKCKTVEKQIPMFINRDMSPRAQREFLVHIDNCESCREELSIQFLVTEGMNVLDGSDSYDLQNALNVRLHQARHEMRIHRRLFWIRNILVGIVALAFAGAIIFFAGNMFFTWWG